jgi:hypothetical protein
MGPISRRLFAGSAGLLGLGAAVGAVPAAAALPFTPGGQHLDLGRSEDALAALIRVRGGTGAPVYGWFDGAVMAVAPGGQMRAICGFRGVSRARLTPLGDRFGWRADHAETGYYYDKATGAVLRTLANDITGRNVEVSHVHGALDDDIFDLDRQGALTWSQDDGQASVEEAPHRMRHAYLDASGAEQNVVRAIQTTLHAAPLDEVRSPGSAAVAATGSWARVTPWPAWMGMGQTPGHCLHHCRFSIGAATPDRLPHKRLADVEALRPAFLTAQSA